MAFRNAFIKFVGKDLAVSVELEYLPFKLIISKTFQCRDRIDSLIEAELSASPDALFASSHCDSCI